MDPVVTVEGLRKAYGDVTAAADVTFEVDRGEVFGMVGPNGAGKTTILECVTGLRRPDAGRVRVLGLDPQRDRYAVRERIGVQLQAAALPDALQVGEAVALFASFYPRAGDPAAALRPNARAVPVVGNVLAVPMLFLSGATAPLEVMPAAVQRAAQLNPLYHAVTLLRGAWFGEPWSALAASAAVIAGLLVVAAAFAAWRFRWEA